jgi:hypothetical protein
VTDVTTQIVRATRPEDLFGALTGTTNDQLAAVKRSYHHLAQLTHPDIAGPAGRAAFDRLAKLKAEADTYILDGTYGTERTPPVTLTSRKRIYTLIGPGRATDLASLYPVTYGDPPERGLVKVAAEVSDNDLLTNEAAILTHLRTPDRPEAAGFAPMLPTLIDSFDVADGMGSRRVNAFATPEGFISLTQVQKAYPTGLPPKHMAWIWRQLLLALGYAHVRGVIHGAVLPHHILIHPSHDLILVDWCCAVKDPDTTALHIPAIADRYADWYPPEVAEKIPPTPATDIAMSAHCMLALLGQCPTRPVPNPTIHPRLYGFLASCLPSDPSLRPQDAWELRDEFTRLIERLWGPRRRIPFTMPTPSHA